MKKIILASKSPRRKELMSILGLDFEIVTEEIDESIYQEHYKIPRELVKSLSYIKAKAVFEKQSLLGDCIVIGADTVVAKDSVILGKPESESDAFRMLGLLRNSKHYVYTGVTVFSRDKTLTFYEKTAVYMRDFSDGEIARYIKSGEPFDKAGAYAIQGFGGLFVTSIKGDYNNIVGLPITKLYEILKELI